MSDVPKEKQNDEHEWQGRLLGERDQLVDRLQKLAQMLDSGQIKENMSGHYVNLLWHQRLHMERYLDVLVQRIRLAGLDQ